MAWKDINKILWNGLERRFLSQWNNPFSLSLWNSLEIVSTECLKITILGSNALERHTI